MTRFPSLTSFERLLIGLAYTLLTMSVFVTVGAFVVSTWLSLPVVLFGLWLATKAKSLGDQAVSSAWQRYDSKLRDDSGLPDC